MPDTEILTRPPIVETAAGRVSGLTSGGVHVFKGIPYGASTAGKNRFMPPARPEPWNGVRECTAYAGRSPQAPAATQRPELATVWGPVDTLPVGEDCLTLHVWTPGLDDAQRPVMVWLHGGAFSYGSANSPRYDSTNLAKRNDVVVVAVNHRLNIFGHLDLSVLDDRFAQSGNAGVLDLVAALQWVKEHASRFGGDAGNVTIFGQSGGGGKDCALMAMPSAKGLFHKAIVQSGASVRFAEPERTTRLADAVLRHLGLGRGDLDKLQSLPLERLQQAVAPAQAALGRPRQPLLDRYNFGPVVDGKVLTSHPFDPESAPLSDGIPVMVGDTKDESAIFLAPDDMVWNRAVTEDELRKRVSAVAGDATDTLLAYYKKRDPAASDRPADHHPHPVELRCALAHPGRAQGRARQGAGVYVPARLGDAGLRRQIESAALARRAVRVRHAACHRPGTPQEWRPGFGRPHVEDLGRLRPHGQSTVGGLCRRQTRDNGLRQGMPSRRRPRRRGLAALDEGGHWLEAIDVVLIVAKDLTPAPHTERGSVPGRQVRSFATLRMTGGAATRRPWLPPRSCPACAARSRWRRGAHAAASRDRPAGG